MERRKIFYLIVFSLILATFGCAASKFNAYAKSSGYLPVSLNNRDATVIVIGKWTDPVTGDHYKIHGSGVVLSANKDGSYVLTNHHVVTKDEITGENIDLICAAEDVGEICYDAAVMCKDADYDLAVIFVFDKKFKKTVQLGVKKDYYKPGRIIYNWGFPKSFKKTLGYGYISTSPSPEPYFGVGNRLLAQLPDGPGTSGSGIFDSKTHLLIGLMQGSGSYSHFVIRYFIPSTYIKEFLDKNQVRYRAAE